MMTTLQAPAPHRSSEEVDRKAKEWLQQAQRPVSAAMLAAGIGISASYAHRVLTRLAEAGFEFQRALPSAANAKAIELERLEWCRQQSNSFDTAKAAAAWGVSVRRAEQCLLKLRSQEAIPNWRHQTRTELAQAIEDRTRQYKDWCRAQAGPFTSVEAAKAWGKSRASARNILTELGADDPSLTSYWIKNAQPPRNRITPTLQAVKDWGASRGSAYTTNDYALAAGVTWAKAHRRLTRLERLGEIGGTWLKSTVNAGWERDVARVRDWVSRQEVHFTSRQVSEQCQLTLERARAVLFALKPLRWRRSGHATTSRLMEKLLNWARTRNERFTRADAAQALQATDSKTMSILVLLLSSGAIRRVGDVGSPDGYIAEAASPTSPIADLTTASLRKLIQDALDSEAAGRRGVRSADERLRVRTITASQAIAARWALNTLEPSICDSEGRIPAWLYQWDEESSEWAGLGELTKHLKQWAAVDRDTVHKLVASTRLMLDVAANRGLIDRVVAPYPDNVSTPWLDAMAARADQIAQGCRDGKGRRRRGARVLAQVATALGQSVESPDWGAIRREVERRFTQGDLSRDDRNIARRVYLACPDVVARGGDWEEAPGAIAALVPNGVLRATAYATPDDRDWKLWETTDGISLEGLVEGPYGLATWTRWVECRESQLRGLGLPERRYPTPSPAQAHWMEEKLAKGVDLFHCAPATVHKRYEYLMQLATWACQSGRVTPDGLTLQLLADPDLLEAYTAFREQEADRRGTDVPRKQLASIAGTLKLFASPFLESQAIARGDTSLAETFHANAIALGKQQDENACEEDVLAKDLEKIVTAWSLGDRAGYLKVLDLRRLLERDLEALVGMSIEEQLDRIRRGDTDWQTLKWATRARDLLVVTVLRKVPFRRETLSRLQLDWLKNSPSSADELQRSARSQLLPWEGGLSWMVPASVMKRKAPFKPTCIASQDCGKAAYEDDLGRWIYELYLHPNGARARLLRDRDGNLVDTPFVFVAGPAKQTKGSRAPSTLTGARRRRMSGAALSRRFRELVTQYAERLHIDIAALREQHGALTLHVFRLLYGSYWVNRGELAMASKMLHHSSIDTTARYYWGQSESSCRLALNESDLAPVTLAA